MPARRLLLIYAPPGSMYHAQQSAQGALAGTLDAAAVPAQRSCVCRAAATMCGIATLTRAGLPCCSLPRLQVPGARQAAVPQVHRAQAAQGGERLLQPGLLQGGLVAKEKKLLLLLMLMPTARRGGGGQAPPRSAARASRCRPAARQLRARHSALPPSRAA